jgi:hypothetical protein
VPLNVAWQAELISISKINGVELSTKSSGTNFFACGIYNAFEEGMMIAAIASACSNHTATMRNRFTRSQRRKYSVFIAQNRGAILANGSQGSFNCR